MVHVSKTDLKIPDPIPVLKTVQEAIEKEASGVVVAKSNKKIKQYLI